MSQLTISNTLYPVKLLDIQERIFGESAQEKIKKIVFERKIITAQKNGKYRIKGGKKVIDILDECGIGFNEFQCVNLS